VEVVVLDVNKSRERVGLSIKQTQEDPWTHAEKKYRENQLVEGRVTRITDIGAFVELEPGVEGLLHTSELVGAPNVTPEQVLKVGDTVLLKVLEVSASRRRIRLSARRVRREEWGSGPRSEPRASRPRSRPPLSRWRKKRHRRRLSQRPQRKMSR
jgi:small subunit ribosomal protein S1